MTRTWRERLKAAAAKLRTYGEEEDALAIDAVLAPGGWTRLRETEASKSETAPLPLTMDRRLKAALMKAADERGAMPSDVVADGYRAFLEGRFVPPRVQRGGAGYSKTTLTVTVPQGLRDEVRDRIPAVQDEAGYRITLSSIAIEWLMEELGVQRPLD